MNTIFKSFAIGVLATSALSACSEGTTDEPADGAPADTAAADPAAVEADPNATPAAPTRGPALLEEALEGLTTDEGTGVDSVMYIADFPPGSVSAHHSHPGWEYNYIVEGSVTFEVAGEEPFTRNAGEGMYNPRGNSHVVRNASETEPARLVSVLVKEAGAPVAENIPE